nr:ATP-binding protein [Nocardioides convexus]
MIRSFAQREAGTDAKSARPVEPGHRRTGRPGAGRLRRHRDRPGRVCSPTWAGSRPTSARASASSSTRCRTSAPTTSPRSAPPATSLSQNGLPVIVVGAGLPHLPAVLSASKSYSERLFSYQRIDRLSRDAADRALVAPADEEEAAFTADALAVLYDATRGYPYFIQAYGRSAWDLAPRSPITADDVAVAGPEAERELAVGFFGSRYERATPAERDYLRAMADAAGDDEDPVGSVATADVAAVLGKKPQSLSPARDSLLKKGLIYSGERGRIAFTVPHFGRYLRTQA